MASGNTAKDWSGTNYSLLVDSDGYLYVRLATAGPVQTDDTGFTAGSGIVTMIGGFADMSSPDSVNEGDGGAIRMTLDRRLLAAIEGMADEDAAATDAPVQVGGRYDATDRTLDDGDAGGLAIDAAGRTKTLDEGGQEVTALASAARTATTNSSDLTNPGAKGVILTVDATAITDTPSITLNISYKDPVGGNYEKLFSAAAAITAVGVHTYVLYPGDVVAADDVVEVGKLPLPRTWRVEMTHGDADSITYSVSGSYLL